MEAKIKGEPNVKDAANTGEKRKAPAGAKSSPIVTDPSTTKGIVTNTPKRLRISPAHKPAATPVATPSLAALVSSLPSSLTAPQTPSKPQKSSTRKQRIPTDPLNISIYNLRKEGRDWDDIAAKTNNECGVSGGDNELTPAACYSRFFRNGPLVAREKGEEFRKEWYVHMKGKVDGRTVNDAQSDEENYDMSDLSKAEKRKVLKAIEKVQGEFWAKVTAEVNAGLTSKTLTEEEVKEVYERINGGETSAGGRLWNSS